MEQVAFMPPSKAPLPPGCGVTMARESRGPCVPLHNPASGDEGSGAPEGHLQDVGKVHLWQQKAKTISKNKQLVLNRSRSRGRKRARRTRGVCVQRKCSWLMAVWPKYLVGDGPVLPVATHATGVAAIRVIGRGRRGRET